MGINMGTVFGDPLHGGMEVIGFTPEGFPIFRQLNGNFFNYQIGFDNSIPIPPQMQTRQGFPQPPLPPTFNDGNNFSGQEVNSGQKNNRPTQPPRPSFNYGENIKTNNDNLLAANMTIIGEQIVNGFYVSADYNLHYPAEIKIKEIKNCKLVPGEDGKYKVISGEMTLSSPDIELNSKMEEEIIKNLLYYPDISGFECSINLFELFFIAGNKEQAKLAIIKQLQDHNLEKDIDVVDVGESMEETNESGVRNIISDVVFKAYNGLEARLKVKLELNQLSSKYYILSGKEQYSFTDIFKAIVEKLALSNQE